MSASLLADVATVLAAVFAAVGLFLTASAIGQQSRAADLLNLRTFVEEASEQVRRLVVSRDQDQDQEVINYLNFLEVYCAAANNGLLGKTASGMVEERMVNDIAILGVLTPESFKKALTSPETFREIMAFRKRNRAKIHAAETRERKRRGVE